MQTSSFPHVCDRTSCHPSLAINLLICSDRQALDRNQIFGMRQEAWHSRLELVERCRRLEPSLFRRGLPCVQCKLVQAETGTQTVIELPVPAGQSGARSQSPSGWLHPGPEPFRSCASLLAGQQVRRRACHTADYGAPMLADQILDLATFEFGQRPGDGQHFCPLTGPTAWVSRTGLEVQTR